MSIDFSTPHIGDGKSCTSFNRFHNRNFIGNTASGYFCNTSCRIRCTTKERKRNFENAVNHFPHGCIDPSIHADGYFCDLSGFLLCIADLYIINFRQILCNVYIEFGVVQNKSFLGSFRSDGCIVDDILVAELVVESCIYSLAESGYLFRSHFFLSHISNNGHHGIQRILCVIR